MQVIVRNLPDEVLARLKAPAAGRKRSPAEELRDILSEAARPEPGSVTRRSGKSQVSGKR